jgi:cytochrome c5
MKKNFVIILLITSTLFACKTTKNATTTEKHSSKAVEKPVEAAKVVTEEKVVNPAIAQGKSVFNAQCGACHKLMAPELFTKEKWTAIVPIMVQKTNKKAGKEVVSVNDEKAILAYVLSACKK